MNVMGAMMPCQRPAQKPAGLAPGCLYAELNPAARRAFAMIIPGLMASDFGKLIVRPLQRRLRLRCRVTDGIPGCLHQSHLCFELGTRDVLPG